MLPPMQKALPSSVKLSRSLRRNENEKKKRFHDERAADEPHDDMSEYFKRDVFFSILDSHQ